MTDAELETIIAPARRRLVASVTAQVREYEARCGSVKPMAPGLEWDETMTERQYIARLKRRLIDTGNWPDPELQSVKVNRVISRSNPTKQPQER